MGRRFKRRHKNLKTEIESLKNARNTSPRTETAEALKKASAMMFFKYGFSLTFELGILPWGRRRADVIGCKIKGDLVLIEVKSSVADFRSDDKWTEYLPFADRVYLAFTKEVAKKIYNNHELKARIPKRVGILVLGDDGYMKTAKPAKRVTVEAETRISILARLAWRAGDLSKRLKRQRERVFIED
jgi:hypothetical protein